jgi:23S rRNA (uracil1939-C5)-methyltransferase
MHEKVVGRIIELGPDRIVHVSCNAHAAARDLARLVAHGYELVRARPVDLFPHTPHVECVFTLERSAS